MNEEENIKGIIDRDLLRITPNEELPDNCRSRYRTEFEEKRESVLIVEVVWKLTADGTRLESIVDRRIVGKEDNKHLAERITAYLNTKRT